MQPSPATDSRGQPRLTEVMYTIGHHVTAWTLVWLLCACATPALCGVDKRCPMTADVPVHNQGICGNQLSDILKLLCGRGGYHKRSVPDPEDTPLDKHIFLSKSAAASYLGRVRRSAYSDLVKDSANSYSGIVCECCHNSCSIMELSQYCVNPDDNLAMALFHSRHVRKRKRNRQPTVDDILPHGRTVTPKMVATAVAASPKLFPEQKLDDKDSGIAQKTLGDAQSVTDV